MADFMIPFLLCNVYISIIIGILLAARHLLRNILSSRMQYHLWFILLGLLAIPFLPFPLTGISQIFPLSAVFRFFPATQAGNALGLKMTPDPPGNMDWLNDFALSTGRQASAVGAVLLGIWLLGVFFMALLTIKSSLRFRTIKKSSLPLQNREIQRLYRSCQKELKIRKEIPLYSTAFLKSPVMTGILKPCIYLPIHLISDYAGSQGLGYIRYTHGASRNSCPSRAQGLDPIRYMLLHELQHFRHKDALVGCLMTLAGIVYWFNPLVWIAWREMRNDRETACDASVLKMLEPDFYQDYGNTLINFAEKLSRFPFPFTAGLSGNMAQIKRRIINIATYEKPSLKKQLTGMTVFLMTAVLLLGAAPILSVDAATGSDYQWETSHKNISLIDLSSHFVGYEGSFVLYDMAQDAWSIYNREHASLRVSPNSTYKIYGALLGLEEGVITPEDSFMKWNGEHYPFPEWNRDQTLQSAMGSSVNWYFQEIDRRLGNSAVDHYIRKIGYGNENTGGSLSTYWMESSLEISPIEQVELLQKLYTNSFGFHLENINAVKDSIFLTSSESGSLYGKTGTGQIDGRDINGWFVGYTESPDNTYFFAANILADDEASGSNAAKIALSVLSEMNIWMNQSGH